MQEKNLNSQTQIEAMFQKLRTKGIISSERFEREASTSINIQKYEKEHPFTPLNRWKMGMTLLLHPNTIMRLDYEYNNSAKANDRRTERNSSKSMRNETENEISN